jgi:hypothetical protein
MNKLLLRKYFCIYPLYTRFFILPIFTLVLFGMWFWGMMEISCADLVHNEKVLRRVNEETNTLRTVKSRKANWIGHILRRNCLLKRVELFLHTFIVLRLSDSMDEVKLYLWSGSVGASFGLMSCCVMWGSQFELAFKSRGRTAATKAGITLS